MNCQHTLLKVYSTFLSNFAFKHKYNITSIIMVVIVILQCHDICVGCHN